MIRFALIALVILGSLSAALNSADAKQYSRGSNVVHTRRAPVAMHRAFPPFGGVHVYEGGARTK